MGEVEQRITVSEAAARTGLCAATIRVHFDAGYLTGVRNAQGHRLIDPSSLDQSALRGLSLSEAARAMGRSADTVRRLFDAGHLRGFRDGAGHRRIDPASIQDRSSEVSPPC